MNKDNLNNINPGNEHFGAEGSVGTPSQGESGFISSMRRVPDGFQGFVDVSSSNVPFPQNVEPLEYVANLEGGSDLLETAAKMQRKAAREDRTAAHANKKGTGSHKKAPAQNKKGGPEKKPNPSNKKISSSPAYGKKESPERRKARNFCRAVIGIFCGFLCLVFLVILITPDKEFSESENRVLASKPKLSFTTIANGSFMKDFETYLTDQFPLRDAVIALKTTVDRAIGVKQENGVYIGKEGFLFDTPTAFDKNSVAEKTKAISAFTSKYPKMKKAVVISPNSSYIYSDKLPENLKFPSQAGQLETISKALTDPNLNFVDASAILRRAKKAENAPLLFYKTDHHWTTRGAYEIFKELTVLWKLDTKKVSHYFYTLSTEFEGTLGSKSGVHDVTDTIEVCVPGKSLGTYVVNYESQQKKTATLFENEKLEQKNQYEVFLGGNFDKVVISTTSLSNNNLLLIKDSYANCLIPMLTAHFSKIVVIDPRYLTDNMDAIVQENDFTHILFLYNLNTFLEDTSLVDALS